MMSEPLLNFIRRETGIVQSGRMKVLQNRISVQLERSDCISKDNAICTITVEFLPMGQICGIDWEGVDPH